MSKLLKIGLVFALYLTAGDGSRINAQEQAPAAASKPDSTAKSGSSSASKFEQLTKGLKKAEGMFTLYHNEQKLLVLLKGSDLGKDYIVLTSIARGISRGMVLGGMSWGFGDDVIWSFRKVGDKIHVLRRNVRFQAKPGSPEADAVKLAYSDSVLYALPILTEASGGNLVDMTRIFMSDDQEIGRSIGPGFRFASDRSTWAEVKAFPKNVELQVAAVYSGQGDLETVSDPRGVQVHVHYSISELPKNGYKPRVADDRVGYFLTVLKDFSKNDEDENFVRYINRWDLRKKDPDAELSPPTDDTQIIFYIEKTVPVHLRPIVEEGILEWNKAFEKFGFYKAIKVLQQREDDTWDPEDIRYNTFRWITAEAGFAMGPSRVNPKTGQILDADIIFDASFLRYWKTDYETFSPDAIFALMHGIPPDSNPAQGGDRREVGPAGEDVLLPTHRTWSHNRCAYGQGMQQQMGFAASVFMLRGQAAENGELPEEFIRQGLKEVVMHEVGHTLGLRHNFKASTWKSLKDIDDPVKGAEEGTVASVMDYSPPNITPKGTKQGLYYSQTIGPYDRWAIEYGYKPIKGNEEQELAKIASRCAEPGHDYATDEDTSSYDSDPLANRFDLGKNPVEFAQRQMQISSELLPKVVDRAVKEGQGFQRARQAFGLLFSEYWRTAFFAARFPGGIYVHRDHKGDANGRAPFQIVDAATQRQTVKLLGDTVFATPSYDPKVLNHLAATRWTHWGMEPYFRLDYPIHEYVALMQGQILRQLLYPTTLTRLHDSELKVAPNDDAYTLAEHLRALVETIFAEWKTPQPGEYTDRKPYISSFRRKLQRMALKQLIAVINASSGPPELFTYAAGAPEDARTLARMHLAELDKQISALLENGKVKLDDYTRAHLLDSQDRIHQALNAQLEVRSVN